jgi:hypothetical protein
MRRLEGNSVLLAVVRWIEYFRNVSYISIDFRACSGFTSIARGIKLYKMEGTFYRMDRKETGKLGEKAGAGVSERGKAVKSWL